MMGKGKKDKIVKPITDGKSKQDVAKKKKVERKVTDDPKSRMIYPQFVKGAAEAIGISSISEEVVQNLAEDVTCRLKDVVQLCAKFLKHSRHSRLQCDDLNIVFEMFDVAPVLGYGIPTAPTDFMAIREAGVFVPDDAQVELAPYALSEVVVAKLTEPVVRGKWLAIEDQANKIDDQKPEIVQTVQNTEPEANNLESGDYEPKIATILIKYYANICNSILGHTDLTIIYKDLARNDKILPVIPSMLNFITITLNNLGTERQVIRLLLTINALTDNHKLDFRPFHPTLRIASVLLKIIKSGFLERKRDAPLGINPTDRTGATIQFSHSLLVRIKAAQILAKVTRRWCCSEDQIIQEMAKLITDLSLPARVHVGAVTVLKELGPCAMRTGLWNFLIPLLENMENVTEDKPALELAIMNAASVLIRFPHFDNVECPSYNELDRALYDYFGDCMCALWLVEPAMIPIAENKQIDDKKRQILVKGNWQLPKCINSMYNPMAKRQTIQMAFELPKFKKKRNPRIIFKFAGANPVPEISLKRRRLDPRYSQFIAGKVSEGHVVLIGKYWRPPPSGPNYSIYNSSSVFNFL